MLWVDYFEQLLKFLNVHYLTWVPEFINTLFETTEHRFYINLGKILQLLIEKVH